MIKRLMVVLALVGLFASVSNAQWTDLGAFPDTSFTGSTHGIAVDPDGKVWWTSYYKQIPWISGTDTVATNGIFVFNADGTEADFSPIITVATGGGFVVDTLISSGARGLAADHEGNIIYVQSGKIFKINYQTGEGMARHDITEVGSSPTGPGIADDGTIFVGPVVGGGTTQIAMYDTDLNYIGSAVDAPPAISRCLEVSGDGSTIYWTPFTGNAMYIYNRADEFSAFELADSALIDMSIESIRINPATGLLWVSSDERKTTYSSVKWFAFDTVSKTLVDSFAYTPKVPDAADTYPRGLAFTNDGMTAYVGTFSSVQYGITKFVFGEAPTVPITFEADMSVQVDKGNFVAATGTVNIAGTINGWDTGANPMLDGDGDLVYSVTLNLTPGDDHNFKFVMNGDGWESIPDRAYTVPNNADTFSAYFDNDDGRVVTEIAISFQVNMELEIAAQRFDPANDTLSARGSHNGWSDLTLLAPSVTDPNIYEGSHQYESFDGDVIYYKYAYTSAIGTNWETNPPTTSGNYEQIVSAEDITNGYTVIPVRGYNNATLDNVVNQESVVRFEVDMNGAVDGNGVAFTALENVFIAGGNPPLAWPGGGWPDSDEGLVIFLVDDGTNGDATAGDNFWSMNVTFPIYSPFDIEYKYGANWGLPSNGGANDNEGGVGSNHHATLFKSFWSGDAIDVFGAMERKDVVNGVEQIGSDIPATYALSQNYPNPFNPSTVINFSVPESGLVTMKIYNLLGQEVAELVNDIKSAGSYEVSFDASGLTSGMYVYKIQAGQFSATRKMMLLK
jgi:Secretion system C-terminal sorting domain